MSDAFDAQLADPALGLAADLSPESDALLMAFGGIAGAMGIAPYEFFRLASGIPVKKVFVRDLDQAWYHRGVRGAGRTIDETRDSLADVVARSGATRVVTAGNSAGGYAALLFGKLLGAERALAFSPQTFLDRRHRLRHLDARWAHEIRTMRRGASRNHLDLLPLLTAGPATTSAHVHYARSSRLDRAHAERLRDAPGVVLHPHDTGAGHALVNHLKDDGTLERIVREALRP